MGCMQSSEAASELTLISTAPLHVSPYEKSANSEAHFDMLPPCGVVRKTRLNSRHISSTELTNARLQSRLHVNVPLTISSPSLRSPASLPLVPAARTSSYDRILSVSPGMFHSDGSGFPIKETQQLVVDRVKGHIFINEYLIIKDLGRGAHGTVKLVYNTEDDMLYAMKVVVHRWREVLPTTSTIDSGILPTCYPQSHLPLSTHPCASTPPSAPRGNRARACSESGTGSPGSTPTQYIPKTASSDKLMSGAINHTRSKMSPFQVAANKIDSATVRTPSSAVVDTSTNSHLLRRRSRFVSEGGNLSATHIPLNGEPLAPGASVATEIVPTAKQLVFPTSQDILGTHNKPSTSLDPADYNLNKKTILIGFSSFASNSIPSKNSAAITAPPFSCPVLTHELATNFVKEVGAVSSKGVGIDNGELSGGKVLVQKVSGHGEGLTTLDMRVPQVSPVRSWLNGLIQYGSGRLTSSGFSSPFRVFKRRSLGSTMGLKAPKQTDYQTEIDVMKELDHPNLVKLYEVVMTPGSDKLLMIMEYVEGGCVLQGSRPTSKVPLLEPVAKEYFRDILKGVEYLHFNKIVHGDLKPDNLLLTMSAKVKVSDFGSAVLCENNPLITCPLGTPAFMAPEMCTGKPFNGFQGDVWALGVCLYMFMYGVPPFKGNTSHQVYEAVQLQHLTFPADTYASPQLRHLLTRLLAKDPNKRAQLPEIMSHPWITHGRRHTLMSSRERALERVVEQQKGDVGADQRSARCPSIVGSMRHVEMVDEGNMSLLSLDENTPCTSPIQSPTSSPFKRVDGSPKGTRLSPGKQWAVRRGSSRLMRTGVLADEDDDLPPPGELHKLMPEAERKCYKDGEYLIRQGEPSEGLFLILHGQCELSRPQPRYGGLIADEDFADDALAEDDEEACTNSEVSPNGTSRGSSKPSSPGGDPEGVIAMNMTDLSDDTGCQPLSQDAYVMHNQASFPSLPPPTSTQPQLRSQLPSQQQPLAKTVTHIQPQPLTMQRRHPALEKVFFHSLGERSNLSPASSSSPPMTPRAPSIGSPALSPATPELPCFILKTPSFETADWGDSVGTKPFQSTLFNSESCHAVREDRTELDSQSLTPQEVQPCSLPYHNRIRSASTGPSSSIKEGSSQYLPSSSSFTRPSSPFLYPTPPTGKPPLAPRSMPPRSSTVATRIGRSASEDCPPCLQQQVVAVSDRLYQELVVNEKVDNKSSPIKISSLHTFKTNMHTTLTEMTCCESDGDSCSSLGHSTLVALRKGPSHEGGAGDSSGGEQECSNLTGMPGSQLRGGKRKDLRVIIDQAMHSGHSCPQMYWTGSSNQVHGSFSLGPEASPGSTAAGHQPAAAVSPSVSYSGSHALTLTPQQKSLCMQLLAHNNYNRRGSLGEWPAGSKMISPYPRGVAERGLSCGPSSSLAVSGEGGAFGSMLSQRLSESGAVPSELVHSYVVASEQLCAVGGASKGSILRAVGRSDTMHGRMEALVTRAKLHATRQNREGNRVLVCQRGPGTIFGDVCPDSSRPRISYCNVVAKGPVEALLISHAYVREKGAMQPLVRAAVNRSANALLVQEAMESFIDCEDELKQAGRIRNTVAQLAESVTAAEAGSSNPAQE
ncbi:hypothetical protein CEUSTIGMA_g5125.t1 [Chlamydomonas eustigma]|uniref:cGMP-dependent protein kinase n=1 Tax=Chlamydomonas eustigma TaxID=1157962 RepID=A0A250X468_9CHLO|nr:hypothetical protein CEUSTIGMA_g5125.t1 [Chlamydomonas eustigma]|eukprot:GAX77682.1 hypothetical protein CEUSTIGMA_g5125.t1 [Chlamydomonas eustigma]